MSAELQAKVAAMPYWYHRIELPGGVVTPGWAPLNTDHYRVDADLTGLRVLDVGAWDGYWTFLALQRGAKQVVAIDNFSDYIGDAPRAKWENFDLCRVAFGYDESRCSRMEMDVYNLSPDVVGTFDVIFFFGALYHMRHPLLALDKLSSVCTSTIFVESAVCDDFSAYRGFNQGYGQNMVMEFFPDAQLGNLPTNWWAPTTACMANMVRAAGFEDVTYWKLTNNPTLVPHCRGFAKGVKTRA